MSLYIRAYFNYDCIIVFMTIEKHDACIAPNNNIIYV